MSFREVICEEEFCQPGVFRSKPGFEVLYLLDGGLTYESEPIVGWRPLENDTYCPVTADGSGPRKGAKAVRYPDGRVRGLGWPKETMRNTDEWLAHCETWIEFLLKERLETGKKLIIPNALKRFNPTSA